METFEAHTGGATGKIEADDFESLDKSWLFLG